MLTGSESNEDVVAIQTPVLFLPPDAVIDSGDHVTVDGETYEVDGPPAIHNNPRLRRVTHLQVALRQAG